MAVDTQGHRGICVSETSGDRSDIDAGADQLRGREVPQIMQPHVRELELVSDSDEKVGHVVGPERQ